jgi:hypothetical protein
MIRFKPNGCTERHMEKPNRAGPRLRKNRGDPYPYLWLVNALPRPDELENIGISTTSFIKKEKTS